MKKILTLCLSALLLLTSIPLSACQSEKSPETSTISIVKDAATEYKIIRPQSAGRDSEVREAALLLRDLVKTATGVDMTRTDDYYNEGDAAAVEALKTSKEILIGETNRPESVAALEGLAFNEYIIKVDGSKIVIVGACDTATLQAVEYFGEHYISADSAVLEIPGDLSVKGAVDMSSSTVHNMSYEEMGDTILKAFTKAHYRDGDLLDTETWDAAEILEAYVDAYEQTGNATYLEYIEKIAEVKFGANSSRTNWCAGNQYNDDIAWVCISFARVYQVTGDAKYLKLAKKNFDIMYERASSDDLGGGLWWHDGRKLEKNSCIQCPASIAACLIGKGYGDDSYYEKAKAIMDWEFEVLFDAETGRVYDHITTEGNVQKNWDFTYNQGTFIGACMLLHEKYGDQKYLDYADKAMEFSMTKLGNVNGVLNCETSGLDGIGFKGVLTRWAYRYAKYTNNLKVLDWLQLNADTAYGHRNSDNWIWTNWAEPTNPNGNWDSEDAENGKYDIWGLSAAMALLFNCEQWWE